MTLNEFKEAFVKYREYYPEPVMTKELTSIYFMGLSDLSVRQLNNAYIEMIKTRSFQKMPKVAEIRSYALGQTEELMNLRIQMSREKLIFAINKLGPYRSVEFDDKGIHALIDSVGGWQKICLMQQEEFEELFKYRNFEKIYGAYWKLPRNVSQSYLGIHDCENETKNINFIGNAQIGITDDNFGNLIENKSYLLGEK